MDAPAVSQHRFAFTGATGDYFRIWLASLCLSVVTLGAYSAWGKVRKTRYLYAHTRLDGDGFDYRAEPLAILRGRVIALALFGGFALAGHFMPLAQVALILLLIAASPWIVVAAARFRARNTTYRNVAFAFDGGFREAARVLLGGALLCVVTLGLAYPWYRMRRARFVVERHRFGATAFAAKLDVGGFVLAYLIGVVLIVGVLGTVALLSFLVGDPDADESTLTFVVLGLAVPYAGYIAVYGYVRARTQNLVVDATSLGPLRFAGTLRARRLAWLYVSNVVAVIATLGLATPWATVRLARYRADCLTLIAPSALDAFAAGASRAPGASGSEVSDLFDVDVAL